MKKNITINLSGRLFQIDEDACNMLQHYVDSLRSAFGKEEGGDEIVDDIETRIAELFDELKTQGNEAINISHVKDIISRIGRPEELTGDEETDGPNDHRYESVSDAAQSIYNNVRERTAGKKLFRNPKDKMLAGVLSGLATYTDTNPIGWRLATVLLFCCYGFGLLAYIILAIVVPEAKTPEQLLQMEGKEINPQNLADVVVDTGNTDEEQHPTLLHKLCSLMLKVLFGFFVAIAVVVGILSALGALFALVVLVSALVLPVSSSLPFSLETMGLAGLYQSNPLVLILFAISLFMLLLIPIYAIVHMVLSLARRVRPMGTAQRILWIVLWVAALCCVVPCSMTMADYSDRYYHEKYYVPATTEYQGVEMRVEDATYLRRGGWDLLKAENCDHYTYRGQYLINNRNMRYMDVYNESCEEIFQAERSEKVEPGVYSLSCHVRAEGRGIFVYVRGKELMLKEIPPYGNEGGELWESATRMEDAAEGDSLKEAQEAADPKWEQQQRRQIAMANNRRGYGWSEVRIDGIVVTSDSIAYGISTDETFTGQPCRSQWFSATDFKLTRTGD